METIGTFSFIVLAIVGVLSMFFSNKKVEKVEDSKYQESESQEDLKSCLLGLISWLRDSYKEYFSEPVINDDRLMFTYLGRTIEVSFDKDNPKYLFLSCFICDCYDNELIDVLKNINSINTQLQFARILKRSDAIVADADALCSTSFDDTNIDEIFYELLMDIHKACDKYFEVENPHNWYTSKANSNLTRIELKRRIREFLGRRNVLCSEHREDTISFSVEGIKSYVGFLTNSTNNSNFFQITTKVELDQGNDLICLICLNYINTRYKFISVKRHNDSIVFSTSGIVHEANVEEVFHFNLYTMYEAYNDYQSKYIEHQAIFNKYTKTNGNNRKIIAGFSSTN